MPSVDLAVQIMGKNRPASSPYEIGDIVACYEASQAGTWDDTVSAYIPDGRSRYTVLIFLRNVPVLGAKRFTLASESSQYDDQGNEYPDDDPLKKRRAWSLQRSVLPAPLRRALFNEAADRQPGVGHITVRWGVLGKTLFRHNRKARTAEDTDLDRSDKPLDRPKKTRG